MAVYSRSYVSDQQFAAHSRVATVGLITGVARGGTEGPRPPANERKNIKASRVNLTLNMRYKNDKKYQICHH